jgi:chromosome partitioning protein
MGKVLTVMNMKGGVGKTTVAIHLAGIMCKSSWAQKRVLAIDYDPQFNLSQAFLPAKTYFALEKARMTTIAILLDDDTKLDPYHIQVPGNNNPPNLATIVTHVYQKTSYSSGSLDIIPSTLDLMYLALGQSDVKTQPMEERFEKFIEDCRKIYDLILIDCHPAGSLFTKTSLRNSDDVLIPVVPESSYAIRGIGLMMNFIKAKKVGGKSPTPHILLNMTPRFGSTAKEMSIRANPEVAPFCMTRSLKRYKAFSEPEGGKGFVWAGLFSSADIEGRLGIPGGENV